MIHKTMKKNLICTLILLFCVGPVFSQRKKGDPLPPEVERALMRNRKKAEALLRKAAEVIGASDIRSIQYSGTGYHFALGQSVNPRAPWPKFNVKSYTRTINFDILAAREEMVRTQLENPPRGGGAQPIVGEQRQVFSVSGGQTYAWNGEGSAATSNPSAAEERALQIWLTPYGFIRAALAGAPGVTTQLRGGRKLQTVSARVSGKFTLRGVINEQNLVERVETHLGNPVLGDMLIAVNFSDYKDFDGFKFPSRIVQEQGGFPVLDLTIDTAKQNGPVDIQVPQNVLQAAAPTIRVDSQKLADGIWYLTGGTHHSVAVEFRTYVAVIEAPQNEERSLAVIAEVKKLVPNKPIRFLINTHHHFDHSGGIRTYAAQGATIITHQMNEPFYRRADVTSWKLSPDRLAESHKRMAIVTMLDKRVVSDGSRVLELHHIKGNRHNEGIIMGYLPKEKLLIEADVFTPGAPNAPPPATPNVFTVNLYENIQRLKLRVEQIAPLHGRLISMADLLKAIGRSS
jgi:glyoxylase-like metal-dependent hydrolase (beta-lactamase superfamily II)